MNLAGRLMKWAGWSVDVTVPDYPRAIICVAPHTSNWDLIVGKLAYASIRRHAGFLMKESWFFWPLGCIFRAMGGIPVPRGKRAGSHALVETIADMMEKADRMVIAITPEGTRRNTSQWHTGFLRIAKLARVPILLGVMDYEQRLVRITDEFTPSDDIEADLQAIKRFYRPFKGKHSENFNVD